MIMDILRESTPKARKEHICMWCNGKIKKGEPYKRATIKNDYLYDWINHEKCDVLFDKLRMGDCDWGDGIDSDSFMENIYGYLYENLTEEEHDGLTGEGAVDKCIEILKDKEMIK